MSVGERTKKLLLDTSLTREDLVRENCILSDTVLNLKERIRKLEMRFEEKEKVHESPPKTKGFKLFGKYPIFGIGIERKKKKEEKSTLSLRKKIVTAEDIKRGEIKPRRGSRFDQVNIQGKKFLNDPKSAVYDSLLGVVRTYPFLKLSPSKSAQIVTCENQLDPDKHVAIISGGGSGHEPAHALFVARGVLSAAVCGHVFTSPDVDSIVRAIQMVTGRAGCLLVIKNYMGDRLNFKLAAQIAGALGYTVKCVIVDDDSAFAFDETVDVRKKRGLAGTLFVHKIAGAASAKGLPLKDVYEIAQTVISNVATMGVSFSACTLPGQKYPLFEIESDKIEMGLGIHGERGVRRVKISRSDSIIRGLLKNIMKENPIKKGDRILLLVNNLGAVAQLEMFVICSKAIEILELEIGCKVDRVLVGTLMTSLGMKGASLTVIRLPDGFEKEYLEYLDFETDCPVWPKSFDIGNILRVSKEFMFRKDEGLEKKIDDREKMSPLSNDGKKLKIIIKTIAENMVESEAEINALDAKIGDGDCGASLKRGGELILENIDSFDFSDNAKCLYQISQVIQTIGGTSGAVYCSLLVNMSKCVKSGGKWGNAIVEGCDGVSSLGGAKEGECTFLDALYPVGRLLRDKENVTITELVEVSKKGADSTIDKIKTVGRAALLKERSRGYIDPGAQSIVNLIGSLLKIENLFIEEE